MTQRVEALHNTTEQDELRNDPTTPQTTQNCRDGFKTTLGDIPGRLGEGSKKEADGDGTSLFLVDFGGKNNKKVGAWSHPGNPGISVNTHHGAVSIDAEAIATGNCHVQRLAPVSQTPIAGLPGVDTDFKGSPVPGEPGANFCAADASDIQDSNPPQNARSTANDRTSGHTRPGLDVSLDHRPGSGVTHGQLRLQELRSRDLIPRSASAGNLVSYGTPQPEGSPQPGGNPSPGGNPGHSGATTRSAGIHNLSPRPFRKLYPAVKGGPGVRSVPFRVDTQPDKDKGRDNADRAPPTASLTTDQKLTTAKEFLARTLGSVSGGVNAPGLVTKALSGRNTVESHNAPDKETDLRPAPASSVVQKEPGSGSTSLVQKGQGSVSAASQKEPGNVKEESKSRQPKVSPKKPAKPVKPLGLSYKKVSPPGVQSGAKRLSPTSPKQRRNPTSGSGGVKVTPGTGLKTSGVLSSIQLRQKPASAAMDLTSAKSGAAKAESGTKSTRIQSWSEPSSPKSPRSQPKTRPTSVSSMLRTIRGSPGPASPKSPRVRPKSGSTSPKSPRAAPGSPRPRTGASSSGPRSPKSPGKTRPLSGGRSPTSPRSPRTPRTSVIGSGPRSPKSPGKTRPLSGGRSPNSPRSPRTPRGTRAPTFSLPTSSSLAKSLNRNLAQELFKDALKDLQINAKVRNTVEQNQAKTLCRSSGLEKDLITFSDDNELDDDGNEDTGREIGEEQGEMGTETREAKDEIGREATGARETDEATDKSGPNVIGQGALTDVVQNLQDDRDKKGETEVAADKSCEMRTPGTWRKDWSHALRMLEEARMEIAESFHSMTSSANRKSIPSQSEAGSAVPTGVLINTGAGEEEKVPALDLEALENLRQHQDEHLKALSELLSKGQQKLGTGRRNVAPDLEPAVTKPDSVENHSREFGNQGIGSGTSGLKGHVMTLNNQSDPTMLQNCDVTHDVKEHEVQEGDKAREETRSEDKEEHEEPHAKVNTITLPPKQNKDGDKTTQYDHEQELKKLVETEIDKTPSAKKPEGKNGQTVTPNGPKARGIASRIQAFEKTQGDGAKTPGKPKVPPKRTKPQTPATSTPTQTHAPGAPEPELVPPQNPDRTPQTDALAALNAKLKQENANMRNLYFGRGNVETEHNCAKNLANKNGANVPHKEAEVCEPEVDMDKPEVSKPEMPAQAKSGDEVQFLQVERGEKVHTIPTPGRKSIVIPTVRRAMKPTEVRPAPEVKPDQGHVTDAVRQGSGPFAGVNHSDSGHIHRDASLSPGVLFSSPGLPDVFTSGSDSGTTHDFRSCKTWPELNKSSGASEDAYVFTFQIPQSPPGVAEDATFNAQGDKNAKTAERITDQNSSQEASQVSRSGATVMSLEDSSCRKAGEGEDRSRVMDSDATQPELEKPEVEKPEVRTETEDAADEAENAEIEEIVSKLHWTDDELDKDSDGSDTDDVDMEEEEEPSFLASSIALFLEAYENQLKNQSPEPANSPTSKTPSFSPPYIAGLSPVSGPAHHLRVPGTGSGERLLTEFRSRSNSTIRNEIIHEERESQSSDEGEERTREQTSGIKRKAPGRSGSFRSSKTDSSAFQTDIREEDQEDGGAAPVLRTVPGRVSSSSLNSSRTESSTFLSETRSEDDVIKTNSIHLDDWWETWTMGNQRKNHLDQGSHDTSDLEKVKVLSAKLNLTPRRSSTMEWREKYLDQSPCLWNNVSGRVPLPHSSEISQDAMTRSPPEVTVTSSPEARRLTDERVNKINDALLWLRTELVSTSLSFARTRCVRGSRSLQDECSFISTLGHWVTLIPQYTCVYLN